MGFSNQLSIRNNKFYSGYYTVLAALTMIEPLNSDHKVYLIRNPYGYD